MKWCYLGLVGLLIFGCLINILLLLQNEENTHEEYHHLEIEPVSRVPKAPSPSKHQPTPNVSQSSTEQAEQYIPLDEDQGGTEELQSSEEYYENFPFYMLPTGVHVEDKLPLHEPKAFDRSNEWLIFVRIPKCGTKSMATIIENSVGVSNCFGNFFASPAADKPTCHYFLTCSKTDLQPLASRNERSCHCFVNHHCDWHDLNNTWDASDPSKRYVTILREPISRAISEYKHVYNGSPKSWDYCPSKENGSPFTKQNFLDYLNNPSNYQGMKNRQTRMMAGCGSEKLCSEIYSNEMEMLDAAKKHLLECDEFGTLERFGELIVRMNHVFNFNVKQYSIKTETRDNMPLPWSSDEDVQHAVAVMNDLDIELYEFAKHVELLRIKQLESILGMPLPQFHCQNKFCRISE